MKRLRNLRNVLGEGEQARKGSLWDEDLIPGNEVRAGERRERESEREETELVILYFRATLEKAEEGHPQETSFPA